MINQICYNLKNIEKYGANIIFFMEATGWEGEPRIMEPNKCDDVRWFPVDALPQNIMPLAKHVIEMVSKNIFYSEFE